MENYQTTMYHSPSSFTQQPSPLSLNNNYHKTMFHSSSSSSSPSALLLNNEQMIKNQVEMSQQNGHEEEEEDYNSSNKKMMKKGEKKIKKARYAFQTRSHVDILDDGYRWRKYGQKAVKNNNFPRSYYRCTHQGCNVKKQVQRLSKDEGIVVTTYEGMHSHPIEKSTDNFEHILKQMQIYTSF